jgi:hypothetical protein
MLVLTILAATIGVAGMCLGMQRTRQAASDLTAVPSQLGVAPTGWRGGDRSAMSELALQSQPAGSTYPSLEDFWAGRAGFVVQVQDTGLPMGESDTLVMRNGELWSYLHASWRSAGAVDRCGQPVEFPGCVVIYRSYDGGYTFHHDQPLVCQLECRRCPCDSERDHTDQQQYPRVYYDGEQLVMAYEYRARTVLRRSYDGLTWSRPDVMPGSGSWLAAARACTGIERIGEHPYAVRAADCLAGGPPGVLIENDQLFVLVDVGQSPGGLGCYSGPADALARQLRPCQHNPLVPGAANYGPRLEKGPPANPFFDFRTVSSAEVQRIGQRFYVLYEGVRGPGPGDSGDTQFGLGLARSQTDQVDGAWEKYPGNPILADLPGNIGLGHADLVVIDGQTVLYTSADGITRSRLALVWK